MDPRPSTLSLTAHSNDEAQQRDMKRHTKPSGQIYQKSWEKQIAFKGWLRQSKKGPTFAYCKVCTKDMVCVKSQLERHSVTERHKSKFESRYDSKPTSMEKFEKRINLAEQVKTVETRFALWAVEHNIAYNAMDHLSEIIRNSFTDSDIAKQYTNDRIKCSAIVNNVTGAYSFQNTLKLLNTCKFSLIVDESTDKGTIKSLALVCRLLNNSTVTDMFLGLLPVPPSGNTAHSLYATMIKFFDDNNIDYKSRLIGFAADDSSAMMGKHNSLLLKNNIPNLFLIKYSCHSFSLCANYACEKLPRHIEDLAKNIYIYFQTDLNEFQSFIQIKPHKMLQPSQTRWLSLLIVVQELLEQYDSFTRYLTLALLEEPIPSAQVILQSLQDPSTKLYYQFLDFVLPHFRNLNLEMQSETIRIHTLYSRIETTLRAILDCYMLEDYLKRTDIENIEYNNPQYFKQIENINLGPHVNGVIQNKRHGLVAEQLLDFRMNCLSFLIEGCEQIYKRFDPKSESTKLLKQLSIISPHEVISKQHQSIAPLAIKFRSLIDQNQLNDLEREWMQLRNIDLHLYRDLEISEFWRQISTLKLGDGTPEYPNLVEFVYNLFCLPHSGAAVERIFSAINLNQTQIRDNVSTETLNGLLHTKQLLGKDCCYNYEIGENLIKKMNNLRLY